MLHAPVAGCTVGEGKVDLVLEYVDGTVRAFDSRSAKVREATGIPDIIQRYSG